MHYQVITTLLHNVGENSLFTVKKTYSTDMGILKSDRGRIRLVELKVTCQSHWGTP